VVGLLQQSVKDDLTGLSKSAYNATLYWENDKLSARVSAAPRRVSDVPGRNNNDVEGTAETLSIDTSGGGGDKSLDRVRGAQPHRRVSGSVVD
jgi:hypothetical protein